jgi:hypothetical protein
VLPPDITGLPAVSLRILLGTGINAGLVGSPARRPAIIGVVASTKAGSKDPIVVVGYPWVT